MDGSPPIERTNRFRRDSQIMLSRVTSVTVLTLVFMATLLGALDWSKHGDQSSSPRWRASVSKLLWPEASRGSPEAAGPSDAERAREQPTRDQVSPHIETGTASVQSIPTIGTLLRDQGTTQASGELAKTGTKTNLTALRSDLMQTLHSEKRDPPATERYASQKSARNPATIETRPSAEEIRTAVSAAPRERSVFHSCLHKDRECGRRRTRIVNMRPSRSRKHDSQTHPDWVNEYIGAAHILILCSKQHRASDCSQR